MRLTFIAFLLVVLSAATSPAQTVTCSVTGLNAAQTQTVAEFIADKNAEGGPEAPFADWRAYCAWKMKAEVLAFIQFRNAERLRRIGAAVVTKGNEAAPTVQCTAAGLASGCAKSEVACWVLTGSPVCN
jgi:hypothetical protein